MFFENAHSHTVGTIGVLEAETKTGRKKFIFMLCLLFQVTEMPEIIGRALTESTLMNKVNKARIKSLIICF